MTIAELKNSIKDHPDDMEVVISGNKGKEVPVQDLLLVPIENFHPEGVIVEPKENSSLSKIKYALSLQNIWNNK